MHAFRLPIGNSDLTIGAFCPGELLRRHGLSSWSLQPLQTRESANENYLLARGVSTALRQVGVHKAYAPHVTAASARVIKATDLKDSIRLGKGVSLYRRHGVPADGVFLYPKTAFVMSASGCGIITAAADTDVEPRVVVAHAARDSLVDRGAVEGVPTRKHVSVVNTIVDSFNGLGVPPHRIEMVMQFSIPVDVFEHRFDHPQYGTYNRMLDDFVDKRWPGCTLYGMNSVFLNLEGIFVEQATRAGVKSAYATNSLAHFPDLSHTHDGLDRSRRNLFVVKRNA